MTFHFVPMLLVIIVLFVKIHLALSNLKLAFAQVDALGVVLGLSPPAKALTLGGITPSKQANSKRWRSNCFMDYVFMRFLVFQKCTLLFYKYVQIAVVMDEKTFAYFFDFFTLHINKTRQFLN
jgi:hypothetical protein